MKKAIFFLICMLLLAGCGKDYSEGNFTSFQRLAASNPGAAIDELRVFIYHNPEHAESMVLLAELIVADQTASDRDMYLAQYYLRRAITSTENEVLASEAEGLIMQAQLRRGMAPGDPESLVNLAEFARNNGRYQRASELFINASYEYLITEELTRARDQARNAQNVADRHLVDRSTTPVVWPDEYQEALVLLATIKMVRGRLGDAQDYLGQLESISAEMDFDFEQLPSVKLLSTLSTTINSVASRGFFSWRSSSEVSEDAVLAMLIEAEDHNRDQINELRSTLSLQIWTAFQTTLDTDKFEDIALFVENTIEFYSNRLQ